MEYDGTDLYGWQIQKDLRTVQGVLEEILSRRFNEHIAVVGAGRTDKGVHASEQVAHWDSDSEEPVERLYKSLRIMLPPDIVLHALEEVAGDFHARFSAVCRCYRYDIRLQASALERRYCWEVQSKLRPARMRKGLEYLFGTHNFQPFAKLKPDDHGRSSYRCTVFDASLKRRHLYITIRIKADRFMHGMVRAVIGTLVDIGRGAKQPEIIKQILESSDRTLVSNFAPARGLFLEKVEY